MWDIVKTEQNILLIIIQKGNLSKLLYVTFVLKEKKIDSGLFETVLKGLTGCFSDDQQTVVNEAKDLWLDLIIINHEIVIENSDHNPYEFNVLKKNIRKPLLKIIAHYPKSKFLAGDT